MSPTEGAEGRLYQVARGHAMRVVYGSFGSGVALRRDIRAILAALEAPRPDDEGVRDRVTATIDALWCDDDERYGAVYNRALADAKSALLALLPRMTTPVEGWRR